MHVPRLVITPGEPAGIGVDILLALIQQPGVACELVAVADPELLEQRAKILSLPLNLYTFSESAPRKIPDIASLAFIPVKLKANVTPGILNHENAEYVLETLSLASRACQQKQFDALVTGPVHKGIINEAGIKFSGHTEFLAENSGTKNVVMMLATEGLRVALVTTHLPLANISKTITKAHLETVIRILHHDLKTKFQIENPVIIVCGLNPHAGEDGHMGTEEINVIQPVINKLVAEGMHLSDPLPADTAFTPEKLSRTDAVLAMYHDQGLPVIKHMGFGKTVNITLGLPYIRTSVDHGTALTLAGKGTADTGSLNAAIQMALKMV